MMTKPYFLSPYITETAFLLWITKRGFKSALECWNQTKLQGIFLSKLQGHCLTLLQVRQEQRAVQGPEVHNINYRQAKQTYGFQHVRGLDSGKMKPCVQQYEALISFKILGSTSVQPLLVILNFIIEIFLKGNHSSWHAMLALDLVYI